MALTEWLGSVGIAIAISVSFAGTTVQTRWYEYAPGAMIISASCADDTDQTEWRGFARLAVTSCDELERVWIERA